MIKDTNPVTWEQTSATEHPNGQMQGFGTPTHGLNIPLYFSEAGVDPFRQVTWELRTASITNEHGEVVFEQPQVEVPSFWSQTATNVVVSKYFRGALGTPQRETSVKQLISRVANTVTEWGIKDKYFATPQEAENFRAELSILLLTQRASFNSPVWFNVGIEPHPQSSACFILSVEDTMESILDWYRVEGMIFKYGSGSGINLSPIRSAREPLAGGGTASGPVSFMRAADASAGVIKSGGKCFKQGTLVATPDGWRPIESLQIGNLVLTHRGPRPVADLMSNGLKPCYRVRTQEGYEVEVTQEHKFAYWNAGDGRFETKPVECFVPGESLYLLLQPSDGGSHVSLRTPKAEDPSHATTIEEMAFPQELNDEFAYMLGLMYGDGELRRENPYRVRVAFGKNPADQEAAARFRAYGQRLFGEAPVLLGDETGHQQWGYTRKRLIEFLVANGLAKGKVNDLEFPRVLFQAYPKVRAAFIAGRVDSDGTYQPRGGWSISSIDRAFLVEFQRLLLSLGIPSKIRLSREQRGTWQNLYRLSVVGSTFVERLVHHIAPYSAKAHLDFELSDGADKGWGYRPSLFHPLAARVERRGGYQLVERTVGSTNETTGYGALARLAAHPDVAIAGYAQELSQCVQVTLESLEPTEIAETYDIEVADVHLLSANGFYASNTRRAAKMVVLNADHPDIEKFICCKWQEEKKAWTLVDAGYDSSIDGEAYSSVFFQNANNSVRATDEFMKAALEDKPWDLKAVTTAQPFQTVRARELMRLIAEATWNCGDPGMQFDTTINRWHTCPNSGRINASNPCFSGDARVYTDKGLIPFKELAERASMGESFRVFTHDATHPDRPAETISLTRPTQIMQTGVNEVHRLRFSNGIEVACTKNHRFFTKNRGMVPAEELSPDDEVLFLNQPVEFPSSSLAIDTDHAAIFAGGRASGATHGYKPVQLPSVWTTPLAEYLGYLVGDGCIRDGSDSRNRLSTAGVVFGTSSDAEELAPRFRALFHEMGVEEVQEVSIPNGTFQLRVNRTPVVRFFKQVGVSTAKAPEKVVPHTLFKAPKQIIAGFLRGLFTADGCVYDGKTTRYVGLGSTSKQLLLGAQQLLATFGIKSSRYATRNPYECFPYTKKDGSAVTYQGSQLYDLRISGSSIARFKEQIGFLTTSKQSKLDRLLSQHEFYRADETVRLKERVFKGYEPTYNLTEPKNHSYIVNSLIVSNCSEYMSLDNSACNLASLNLMRFVDDSGRFKIADFRSAVRTMTIAMDILVDNSSYPTPKITENAKNFRQLGLGYANLGALLMSLGVPYDSDEGRAYAATVTALMCGEAYRTSAEISGVKGPYAGFARNKEPQLHVIRMHRDALIHVDDRIVPEEMFTAAARTWEEALGLGQRQGVRNSQVSVLAPTGTIGFMMDCDTTGVEPDIALIKYKKLVGGGLIKIVNNTVPLALKKLGYSPEQIRAICDYLNKEEMVEGAPGLDPKHLPIFDCAFKPMKGTRSIHYMGHIRMMGAVQPFISGAISKTVNVPPDATVDEIMQSYTEAWKLGVKAVAIYRDGSKRVQPLSTGKTDEAGKESSDAPKHRPQRRYLPDERNAVTHKFSIAGHDGYVTVGLYEDGKPGEIFIVMSKEGTVISGLLDAFATAISLALQYGVPLEALVKKFSHMRFEPAGITSNPQIRFAQSILDYIFRWMALKFLPADKQPTPPATVTDLAANQADVTQPNSTAGTGSTLEPSRQAIQSQSFQGQVDAPPCPDCGAMMIRSGSCYKCFNCGATSGCS